MVTDICTENDQGIKPAASASSMGNSDRRIRFPRFSYLSARNLVFLPQQFGDAVFAKIMILNKLDNISCK
jgi:hypothetical protein